MPVRPLLRACLISLSLMLLTACATNKAAEIPAEVVRVDCWATLPAELKVKPEQAPPVHKGDNSFAVIVRDRQRERRKDRRAAAVLDHLFECSQTVK